MHSPVFLYTDDRNDKDFVAVTKNDIKATIDFLYKRGMWSKYHYMQWKKALDQITDAETLHLWWDAIVSGAMFETDAMLDEKLDAMRKLEEDKSEQGKMCERQKRLLAKKKIGG